MPDSLVALAILGLMMMIPIIAILTRHQQKMTEMLNSKQAENATRGDVNAHLLNEIAHMRRQMDDMTLAIEQLKDTQSRQRTLETRISG
ncbi:MAG: hypothetical protein ABL949_16145 [Fimbriimonadaceae bacterium]